MFVLQRKLEATAWKKIFLPLYQHFMLADVKAAIGTATCSSLSSCSSPKLAA